jgi:hypothetical protein
MIDSVSKPRLPKGLSYVLKTSQLEEALSDFDVHIDLVYWRPQGGNSILEGQYWLPNENVPHPRVYVRAGVVPSALRSKAADALAGTALPSFAEWLRQIVELPSGSPALHGPLYFNARYTESGLIMTDKPEYKTRIQ